MAEGGAPKAKVTARNNGVLGMMYAVKSGVGIGALRVTTIASTHIRPCRHCTRNRCAEGP
jgi:hypothetical protein